MSNPNHVTRWTIVVCSLLTLLSATFGSAGLAAPVKDESRKTYFRRPVSALPTGDEHLEDLKAAFAVDRIRAERFPEPRSTPAAVKQFLREYKEFLWERADDSYKETGIWFFCRARGHYASGWDECDTAKIFCDLLLFYGTAMEDLPHYSVENHKKAIAFWQSWQNEQNGRFYNPYYQDPQNPEVRRDSPGNSPRYTGTNGKYIPGILVYLGAEPLHPYSFFGGGKKVGDEMAIDVGLLWRAIEQGVGNGGGGLTYEMALRVEQGESQYLPHLEAVLAAWVRNLRPESGMLVASGNWESYHTVVHSFKLFIRLTAYLGLENIPESKARALADTLVEHQDAFARARNRGAWRNAGEYMTLCIQYTDYRKSELLEALRRVTAAFVPPEKSRFNCADGGYCTQALSTFGAYMHWAETPPETALTARPTYRQGAELKLRYVVGPYGNWVNTIEKRPEEILGHPDYSWNKYGMKPRNKIHWQKKVRDVVPTLKEAGAHWKYRTTEPSDDWASRGYDDSKWKNVGPSLDGLNRGDGPNLWLRRVFELDAEDTDLQAPYLKARWNGDFEIYLNGVKVKEIKYGMDETCGLHVHSSARATIKPGKNVIAVRAVKTGPDSFIDVGFIDLTLPHE